MMQQFLRFDGGSSGAGKRSRLRSPRSLLPTLLLLALLLPEPSPPALSESAKLSGGTGKFERPEMRDRPVLLVREVRQDERVFELSAPDPVPDGVFLTERVTDE